MTRITAPTGRFWDAPDPEGVELLRAAVDVVRTPETTTALIEAQAHHDVALDGGATGWSVAAALRTALAIICARMLRDESRASETLAYRDRRYELDALLSDGSGAAAEWPVRDVPDSQAHAPVRADGLPRRGGRARHWNAAR